MTEDNKSIHQVYCNITNRDLAMSMPMHFMWNDWKAKGWTQDDLELVVRHIKSLIQINRRRPESLRFYNLIQNHDSFAMDLADARALARSPRLDKAKLSVLRATGREPEQNENSTRTAAQVLAANKALSELLKLRDNL